MFTKIKLKKEEKTLFEKIAELSERLKMQVYPVGGFVRDSLLGIRCKDIDFIVVGDALQFAESFKKEYGGGDLVTYPKFETCFLNFYDFKLEFVSAREEHYQTESRKPRVKKANLFSDLTRRDFTINTLALEISNMKHLKIIDAHNGIRDLKNGVIRTPLDPEKTFSDDPLRMIRAVRFATCFSFSFGTTFLFSPCICLSPSGAAPAKNTVP